ncbi:hypothetical protein [Caldivirga sp.]|uniref:hypothetical protein n=1 Tax=Caldivirga sp. TaxID=2080243 RepID=UPI0025BD98BE|nr:hypothetical protein [Caldivirga sp.]
MNKLIPALVALSVALAVSVVLAIDHTLTYVSFSIVNPSGGEYFSIQPIYLNLGNLTVGESGSTSASGLMKVNVEGTYEFSLAHEDLLSHEFSVFNVTVTVGSHSFTLSLNNDDYKVYLTPGTYNVNIKVTYVVNPTAENTTVVNLPVIEVNSEESSS